MSNSLTNEDTSRLASDVLLLNDCINKDFSNVVDYMRKVKLRFQKQPEIYHEFKKVLCSLQILSNEKKSNTGQFCFNSSPVCDIELYIKIQKLFQNHDDLVKEFLKFYGILIKISDAKDPFSIVKNKCIFESQKLKSNTGTSFTLNFKEKKNEVENMVSEITDAEATVMENSSCQISSVSTAIQETESDGQEYLQSEKFCQCLKCCEINKRTIENNGLYQSHERNLPFKCTMCSQQFDCVALLTKHQKYACKKHLSVNTCRTKNLNSNCDESSLYYDISLLTYNKSSKFNRLKKRFACYFCNKHFTSEFILNYHKLKFCKEIRSLTNEEKYTKNQQKALSNPDGNVCEKFTKPKSSINVGNAETNEIILPTQNGSLSFSKSDKSLFIKTTSKFMLDQPECKSSQKYISDNSKIPTSSFTLPRNLPLSHGESKIIKLQNKTDVTVNEAKNFKIKECFVKLERISTWKSYITSTKGQEVKELQMAGIGLRRSGFESEMISRTRGKKCSYREYDSDDVFEEPENNLLSKIEAFDRCAPAVKKRRSKRKGSKTFKGSCRVNKKQKMILGSDSTTSPHSEFISQKLLLTVFIGLSNLENDEGRCLSKSFDSLSDLKKDVESKSPALSFSEMKQRLNKGYYKHLDQFQEDLFSLLEGARISCNNSRIFADSIMLQEEFIKVRAKLWGNGNPTLKQANILTKEKRSDWLNKSRELRQVKSDFQFGEKTNERKHSNGDKYLKRKKGPKLFKLSNLSDENIKESDTKFVDETKVENIDRQNLSKNIDTILEEQKIEFNFNEQATETTQLEEINIENVERPKHKESGIDEELSINNRKFYDEGKYVLENRITCGTNFQSPVSSNKGKKGTKDELYSPIISENEEHDLSKNIDTILEEQEIELNFKNEITGNTKLEEIELQNVEHSELKVSNIDEELLINNEKINVLENRITHRTNITDENIKEPDAKHVDEKQIKNSSQQILVQQISNNGLHRKWDKLQYCFFCSCGFTNLAKHLFRNHRNEKKVKIILKVPVKSKDRALLLEKLRNRGNYLHNLETLRNGKGVIVPFRRPASFCSYKKFVPCRHCLAFFNKNDLWKHDKACPHKSSGELLTYQKLVSYSSLLLPVPKERGNVVSKLVFSRMHKDHLFRIIKNDYILLHFADKLYSKVCDDNNPHLYVSQKLREIARFLHHAKTLNTGITNLADCLSPQHFQSVISSVKAVAGYDEVIGNYKTTSLPMKLGHSLKKCAYIKLGICHEKNNEAGIESCGKFLELMGCEWETEIFSNTNGYK